MTVEKIIIKYLKQKGFDGLVQPDHECGCEISDLIPCDLDCSYCEPGYKIHDKTGEFDFLITTKKPK